jgi:hypothetical protein
MVAPLVLADLLRVGVRVGVRVAARSVARGGLGRLPALRAGRLGGGIGPRLVALLEVVGIGSLARFGGGLGTRLFGLRGGGRRRWTLLRAGRRECCASDGECSERGEHHAELGQSCAHVIAPFGRLTRHARSP